MTEVIALMDDMATVRPVTYSGCSWIVGTHIPVILRTKRTIESAGTEDTLYVYCPKVPCLTPIHTVLTQLAVPSHEMQYVPLHTCRVYTTAPAGRVAWTLAKLVGMFCSRVTRLSAEASGCFAKIICASTLVCGVD